MKPTPHDLHRRLAAALERIQVMTAAAGRRAADGAQLSPLQMGILRTVIRRPGLRAGGLARALEVTPGTLSVALSTLEAKGLIVKERDAEEHRAIRVQPTPGGRTVAASLEAWPDATLQPVIEDLGDEEAGQVLAGLLTLLRAAEARGLIDSTRMCLHCRHFRPWQGEPAKGRPHRCELLGSSLAAAELQIDCPEFEDADPEIRAARTGVLSPD